jgi:cytochrome c oxidase cbb3-type subunit 3
VACHAADGTGNIGPNLTDATWIHGGTPDEINNTVFFGVEGRGMIGWGPVLGAQEVASLAAYVHSLGGGQ